MYTIKFMCLIFSVFMGSVFSVPAQAMTCLNEYHSVGLCTEICSGLDPFGFIFCL